MEKTHDFVVKPKSADRSSADLDFHNETTVDSTSFAPPTFQLKAGNKESESEDKEDISTTVENTYQLAAEDTTPPVAPNNLDANVDQASPLRAPIQLKANPAEGEEKEEKASLPESSYQLAAEGIAPPPDSPNDGADDQGKPNNTGLPTQLKAGVESLSGFSLDDVKVHYNSDKPAQLKAHAYAQGTDIHIASGQERHLPHEAWHVVQQKQGRVQPTTQLKAFNINDDVGLEKEADEMGAKAMQLKAFGTATINNSASSRQSVVQRVGSDDDELMKKMGMFKYKEAKKRGKLHLFSEMSDSKLQEILLQKRSDFIDDLTYGFLEDAEELPENKEPQSYLGYFMSKIGWGGAEKDEEDDIETGPLSRDLVEEYAVGENKTTEQSLSPETAKNLVEDEEEESEGSGIKDAIISQIEIDLGDVKIPDDMSVDLGALGEGEIEGKLGGKISKDGISGEAKVEISIGHGDKVRKGFGTFGGDGTSITAGGTLEGHVGAKGSLEGEASFNPVTYEGKVKGKAGGSLGATVEGTTQVLLRGGGMDLGRFTVKGGGVLGLAGEFTYIAKWEGGQLTIGNSGKAAVGLGLSWGYSMKINTPGMLGKIGDKLSSWAKLGWDYMDYIGG